MIERDVEFADLRKVMMSSCVAHADGTGRGICGRFKAYGTKSLVNGQAAALSPGQSSGRRREYGLHVQEPGGFKSGSTLLDRPASPAIAVGQTGVVRSHRWASSDAGWLLFRLRLDGACNL